MILGIALFGVITATTTGLLLRTDDGGPSSDLDPLSKLERLFALLRSGALTEEEYPTTKADLLSRVWPSARHAIAQLGYAYVAPASPGRASSPR